MQIEVCNSCLLWLCGSLLSCNCWTALHVDGKILACWSWPVSLLFSVSDTFSCIEFSIISRPCRRHLLNLQPCPHYMWFQIYVDIVCESLLTHVPLLLSATWRYSWARLGEFYKTRRSADITGLAACSTGLAACCSCMLLCLASSNEQRRLCDEFPVLKLSPLSNALRSCDAQRSRDAWRVVVTRRCYFEQ